MTSATARTSTRAAVLAVDGGNSKTELALVAADGTVLAAARGPGCSHQRLGLEGAAAVVRESAGRLRAAAGLPPGEPLARIGVFCLAGIDLPVDEHRVGAALRAERLTDSVVLHNDTFAVLWAGSPAQWGVAVGAGTGLNCVGIAPDGRDLRFAALGRISGDWVAGGRWLGVRALGQAVRAADGRGRRTALETAVPRYFGLADPMAVAEAVYTGRIAERQLLVLAPTVFRTAAEGDEVARELLDQLASEIVTYVGTAVRRLGLARTEVPVVLGGGLFDAGDGPLLDTVRRGVAGVAPRATVRILTSPPVTGAALRGLRMLGVGAGAEADVGAGGGGGAGSGSGSGAGSGLRPGSDSGSGSGPGSALGSGSGPGSAAEHTVVAQLTRRRLAEGAPGAAEPQSAALREGLLP
ncbi:BadF/BadG/BcrA/BcrD ATPase family protein [Streptomyces sp. NPDC004610]|uniref:N-acetylglucosamine kinase n=1 Tax=unclassified Streptomyces TaxID=2593676 RepID=UPI00339EA873